MEENPHVVFMNVSGFESIKPLLDSESYLFKLLANDSGIVLFPHTSEHRDMRQPGIHYADDSQGNALAAMVKPGRIEFRFHSAFSDERVQDLAKRMLESPAMAFAREFTVTYQGRTLI